MVITFENERLSLQNKESGSALKIVKMAFILIIFLNPIYEGYAFAYGLLPLVLSESCMQLRNETMSNNVKD
jgi:hypothetical protein